MLKVRAIKGTGQYCISDGAKDVALVQTKNLADKFAAAPDLLEALKTLDARGGLGLDVHEWIRGLINKAEGVAK